MSSFKHFRHRNCKNLTIMSRFDENAKPIPNSLTMSVNFELSGIENTHQEFIGAIADGSGSENLAPTDLTRLNVLSIMQQIADEDTNPQLLTMGSQPQTGRDLMGSNLSSNPLAAHELAANHVQPLDPSTIFSFDVIPPNGSNRVGMLGANVCNSAAGFDAGYGRMYGGAVIQPGGTPTIGVQEHRSPFITGQNPYAPPSAQDWEADNNAIMPVGYSQNGFVAPVANMIDSNSDYGCSLAINGVQQYQTNVEHGYAVTHGARVGSDDAGLGLITPTQIYENGSSVEIKEENQGFSTADSFHPTNQYHTRNYLPAVVPYGLGNNFSNENYGYVLNAAPGVKMEETDNYDLADQFALTQAEDADDEMDDEEDDDTLDAYESEPSYEEEDEASSGADFENGLDEESDVSDSFLYEEEHLDVNRNPAHEALLRQIQARGINPNIAALIAALNGEDNEDEEDEEEDVNVEGQQYLALEDLKRRRLNFVRSRDARTVFDFFCTLSTLPELMLELAKHLRIQDFVSLYAISKDFHETINGHLRHSMKLCAAHNAPESAKIFLYHLYGDLCIPDPVGRPNIIRGVSTGVRSVPSLRWLTMVYYRDKTVRDILACLARESHRTPKNMPLSLKKMWLTMDISTSARRVQLMHNKTFWTDQDLYNIQMFVVKLDMRFNDPTDGPGDDGLRRLMLGQRGLTPLASLLKRKAFLDNIDIVRLALRYTYELHPEDAGKSIFGIPFEELGIGHLEGWGTGKVHLLRPDELVMHEAIRRNLCLDDHLMMMLLWGYVDPATKQNITVTEEEMYMSPDSDEEIEKEALQIEEMLQKELAGLTLAEEDILAPIVGCSEALGPSFQPGEDIYETEDEDMPLESMQDDDQDLAAIGPSGWRRKHDDDEEQDGQMGRV